MAWTSRTLSNAADCLTKFKEFVAGSIGAVTGVRLGDGRLVQLDVKPGVVSEDWTLTCTVEDGDGGTFSVVGSISGAQADATVGVPYSNDFISFLILDGDDDYAVDDEFIFTAAAGGLGSQAWEVIADTEVGTGTSYDYTLLKNTVFVDGGGSVANGTLQAFLVLDGYSALETWSLTCIAGGNPATFSVVGSVSGAQANATTGVPYNNGHISFTLSAGDINFASSDVFTVTHSGLSAGGQRRVLVFRSRGLAGSDDNLYHTLCYEFYPAVDRWFIAAYNHSAYLPSLATLSQANITPAGKRIRLVDSAMPAIFIADGRSAKMLIEATPTARQCNYFGFFIPHADASLGEYLYPVFTGGCCGLTSSGTPDSYAGADYKAFFCGGYSGVYSAASIAMPSNAWWPVQSYFGDAPADADSVNCVRILPWVSKDVVYFHGGCYGDLDKKVLIPSLIISTVASQYGIFGEFSGVKFVSGHSVAAWDLINDGVSDWLVWNSPKQSGNQFYAAFELSGSEFV